MLSSGNQGSVEVIKELLDAFPAAATTSDPEGKLPLHWMAIAGPLDSSVIQPLVTATKKLCHIVDDEGWTPVDYAKQGDYPHRKEMIDILHGRNSINTTPAISMSSRRGNSMASMSDVSYSPSAYTSPIGKSTIVIGNQSILSASSKYGSSPMSSGQSILSVSTTITKGSTHKTVAKLNAQTVKLRAEAAFNEAEYEGKLVNQREEHDDAMLALDASIDKTLEKTHTARIPHENNILPQTKRQHSQKSRIHRVRYEGSFRAGKEAPVANIVS